VGESEQTRDICERTFQFALRVINLCRNLETRSGVNRDIARQLLRSATSVGANVEQAQSGQSRADFLSKCNIALKESRETRYWLRLISASNLLPASRLSDPVTESDELVRILGKIVSSTRGRGGRSPMRRPEWDPELRIEN
jgi:four helix bundle protein